MSNHLANYDETVVYAIYCKNESVKDTYIGHTTNYKQRYKSHKSNLDNINSKSYNCKVYKVIRENGGWDNWDMSILENFPCQNADEAREREGYWIEYFCSSLNVVIPNRVHGEYAKMYRLINRQYLSDYAKKYRSEHVDKIKAYIEENKDKICEQKKIWYETNKDELLEKAKVMYDKNKDKKIEYQKEYAEQNKDKIKEYQDKYREENKEKLAADKKIYREKEENKEKAALDNKEWREKNKDKIKEQNSTICVCECGSNYTHGNRIRHLQSKAHINFFNPPVPIEEDAKELALAKAKELAKEKQKAYRLANAEKIRLSKQKYNEANKEKNKEQCKKYYELNSDKIKQQNKQYQEEHKEQVKQYSKEWYEANKESILEKQQTTYTCECGSVIRLGGKQEHLKSAKHTAFSAFEKGGAKSTNPPLEEVEPNQQIHL